MPRSSESDNTMRAKVLGMSVRAALLACLLPACSSGGGEAAAEIAATSAFGPLGSQSEDRFVCPSTVDDTIGAACDVEGAPCYPEYACGIAPAIATCHCSGGHFACQDLLDAALGPDATPGCPPPVPTPPTCPATMTLANGTACSQAGVVCTYASPCTGSIPAYLDCLCVPALQIDGGVYLAYECPAMTCLPTDAGSVALSAVDAAAEATLPPEAGSFSEASRSDAPGD
jgi:hypothetical protein